MRDKIEKTLRILDIYVRLCEGKVINKKEEADKFAVDERSIQRDIDEIRKYLAERVVNNPVLKQSKKNLTGKMIQWMQYFLLIIMGIM